METFYDAIKICYRTLAHAYVINRPFAIQLMNYPYQQTAFDDMLANLDGTYYAIYPSFAFQDDSVSDNTVHLNLDTFRRLWGGLIRIQKRNEFYHRHRMLIIFLHCLFIFFIVVIAFVWSKNNSYFTMKTHKTMLKNQSVFLYPWVARISLSAPVCVRWRTGRLGSGHAGLAFL